uniref:Uncharacterized protein n=1 Tax=Oryza punctata TaxID=4537 RepID=A0A0E0KMK7_ORYPU
MTAMAGGGSGSVALGSSCGDGEGIDGRLGPWIPTRLRLQSPLPAAATRPSPPPLAITSSGDSSSPAEETHRPRLRLRLRLSSTRRAYRLPPPGPASPSTRHRWQLRRATTSTPASPAAPTRDHLRSPPPERRPPSTKLSVVIKLNVWCIKLFKKSILRYKVIK